MSVILKVTQLSTPRVTEDSNKLSEKLDFSCMNSLLLYKFTLDKLLLNFT